MNENQLLDLCEAGCRAASTRGADQAEVFAAHGGGISVEFEKNDLQIAMSDEETNFGIRVLVGDNVGFATSNDPDTLEATAADAIQIARTSVPDPCNRLPEPRAIEPVAGLFDPACAGVSVEHMTELGARILDRVKARDERASIDSGSVGAGYVRRAIVSTRGVRASESTSSISGSLFGMAVDGDAVGSFVVEGEAARRLEGFESALARAADRFVDKALGALEPVRGESYHGSVLFTPEAVQSLLVGNLVGLMSAAALRKGKSPLVGRLGERIASPSFSLRDDGTIPGGVGSSSFDREGLPHTPLALVERGTFANVLYDTYEALAAGHAAGSTGHAAGGSANPPSVGTTMLAVDAGDVALDDIVSGVDRCVVVTRFSGSTNPVTGEFSGVVKAGHLLKRGERRPITETLIAGNLLDVLNAVEAVSRERRLLWGRAEMPWILAGDVSVTAG